MSDLYQSLSHSKWDCKYHKESEIIEGHAMPDHIHMLIAIPPKYKVSEVIGFMKGKSAIAIARKYRGKERNYNGESFWARGYAVSTVGFEEEQIRKYIKEQDENKEGSF